MNTPQEVCDDMLKSSEHHKDSTARKSLIDSMVLGACRAIAENVFAQHITDAEGWTRIRLWLDGRQLAFKTIDTQ